MTSPLWWSPTSGTTKLSNGDPISNPLWMVLIHDDAPTAATKSLRTTMNQPWNMIEHSSMLKHNWINFQATLPIISQVTSWFLLAWNWPWFPTMSNGNCQPPKVTTRNSTVTASRHGACSSKSSIITKRMDLSSDTRTVNLKLVTYDWLVTGSIGLNSRFYRQNLNGQPRIWIYWAHALSYPKRNAPAPRISTST